MVSVCSTVEHTIWLCDYPISWSATGDFWSGAAAVVGVFFLWRGLDTFKQWQKQKLTERRIEQAETILAATYRALDALKMVRVPHSRSWEEDEAYRHYEPTQEWRDASEDRRKRLIIHRAYGLRLKRSEKYLNELSEVRPMARAFFDPEVDEAIISIARQFFDMDQYIEQYMYETDFTKGMGLRIKNAMYPIPGHENEMDNQVRCASDTIEKHLLSILGTKPKPLDGDGG